MIKKLNCIMLIDDNPDDNFFHERVIQKCDAAENVIVMQSASAALEYLRSQRDPAPDLIFLDINMPGMNGWEFLEEYNLLEKSLLHQVIVIMLTTSENPDDHIKSVNLVTDFKSKPLTKTMLEEIIAKHF